MTVTGPPIRQNDRVTSSFPAARRGKLGYDRDEVDQFLVEARRAYGETARGTLTSTDIRHAAFRVVRRNGYSLRHVDSALERLEEAFASRERDRAMAEQGDDVFFAGVRAIAQEIVDRLARPPRHRFRRTSALARGYHPDDVDAFVDRISAFFQHGTALPVETVRTIAFRSKLGGYDETQVDVVLDAVIGVMLAVR
jgi:DivIVA domain-containing protein